MSAPASNQTATSVLLACFALLTAFQTCQSATKDELVAAVLIAEAGGETDARAMAAVFEVISNRAQAQHKSKAAIVKARFQFSCLNQTTPAKLIAKAKQHKRWLQAVVVARSQATKQTKGATNYYSSAMMRAPYWAVGKKPTVKIGNHIFYDLH